MSTVDFWTVLVSILTVLGVLYAIVRTLSKGLANVFNLKIIQPINQNIKDLTSSVNDFKDMVKDTFKGYDRKFNDNDKRLKEIEEHIERHDIELKEHDTKMEFLEDDKYKGGK